MKISYNDLFKYRELSNDIINSFNELFPSGIEFIELIQYQNKYKYKNPILHYCIKYFELSKQEKIEYYKYFDIINSDNVWESNNVRDSKHIWRCSDIIDSRYVRHCLNVTNSQDIYSSNLITDCIDVKDSNLIKNSKRVFDASDISDSENIISSVAISWSKNIIYGIAIESSEYIIKSNGVINSKFCSFLNGCSHCLFCTGLEDKDYYLFNEPISIGEFEKINEQLNSWLIKENTNPFMMNYNSHNEERMIAISGLDCIYTNLSKDFYGLVGTLPNYSDEKFISLFFHSLNN